jgi:RNA polymerase sigma-70 factor (ECF subfamily)
MYWTRLARLYGPILDFWLQQAGVAVGDRADVQQEILSAVARNIDQYKHTPDCSGSLRRWMWGIARHKIADCFRDRQRRPVSEGGTEALMKLQQLPDLPFEDSDPNTQTRIRKELCSRALAILQSDFAETTWRAFWLTVIEDHSADEVAEQLSMTKHAIRQARYRVLRRLREELGDDLPQ